MITSKNILHDITEEFEDGRDMCIFKVVSPKPVQCTPAPSLSAAKRGWGQSAETVRALVLYKNEKVTKIGASNFTAHSHNVLETFSHF